MSYCIINCTVRNKDEAVKIAKELVKNKLIACCNIIPSVTSIYEWEEAVQEDSEALMVMKTRIELFKKVKKEILKLHEYEVPEIIAIPIINGNEHYLNWINEQTEEVL